MGKLLLAFGALAALALVLLVVMGPGSESPPNRGAPAPAPDPVGGRVPVDAPTPPAGGILVLRDGVPSAAHVATLPEPLSGSKAVRGLGEAGPDGLLRALEFRLEPVGYVFAATDRFVAPPVRWREEGVALSLGDGCVVSGRVLTGDGRPVEGVLVASGGPDRATTSDASGRYRLTGLMPLRMVRVGTWTPGGREAAIEIEFSSWADAVTRDFVVETPPEGGILLDIRFAEPPGETPELRIEAEGRESGVELPVGDCCLRLPPFAAGAEVGLRVVCPGFRATARTVVAPAAGELLRVRLDVSPGGLPAFGRVVDAEGRAVVEAEVLARTQPAIAGEDLGSRTTDGRGRFRIPPRWQGRHLLAVRPGEASSGWLHLTPDLSEVVLVLGPGAIVEGRVLDRESGVPIPRVPVVLALEHEWAGEEWRTETDEAGAWRFDGVPPGAFAWPWVVSSLRAAAVEEGREHGAPSRTELVAAGRARVIERAGEVFRRDLEAIRFPGGEIRIVAVLPDGAKDADRVEWEQVSVMPGRSWRMSSSVEPRSGRVELVRYLPRGTNRVSLRVGRFSGTTGEIEVAGDGDLGERTISLSGGARVIVQLVDGEGRPAGKKGVRVFLAEYEESDHGGGGSGLGSVVTDAAGRADVSGELPGPEKLERERYSIRVTLQGQGVLETSPWSRHANLVLSGPELARRLAAAGEELVLDVPLLGAIPVLIRTVDPAGRPVPGVRLDLASGSFSEEAAVSDSEGRVTAGALFDPRDWDGDVIRVLPPHLGQPMRARGAEAVLTVSPARSVTVRTLDDEGRPVAGASPRVGSEWHGSSTRRGNRPVTGADGRLELLVPEGDARIDLRFPDLLSLDPVTIPADATEVEHRVFRLDPVRIRVVTPRELEAERELDIHWDVRRGESIHYARGSVARAGPGRMEGEVRLPRLPRHLRVVSPDERWEVEANVGPTEDEVVLTLERRKLHDVAIRLVDREGNLLADLDVFVDRRGDRPVDRFLPERARTDAGGRLVFSVPAGDWMMSGLRTEAGHWSGWFTLHAPAEETVKVEMRSR